MNTFAMNIEVEQKHRVEDRALLQSRLADRGAALGAPQQQVDTYFAHPSRDFSQTDEALRIRTVGNANFVTYKGPKFDTVTKTRRELELPIEPGPLGAAQFAEFFEALGFSSVAQVIKMRRSFFLESEGLSVTGAWDEIEGLGTFVELEVVTEEAKVEQAQHAVVTLASELALGPSERRSYLEMVLVLAAGGSREKDGGL